MIRLGPVAFWLGLLLALIVSFDVFHGLEKELTIALVILGALVGYLNITPDETRDFLLAGIAIMLSASLIFSVIVNIGSFGEFIIRFLQYVIVFTASAITVVALGLLWEILQD